MSVSTQLEFIHTLKHYLFGVVVLKEIRSVLHKDTQEEKEELFS